MEAKAFLDLKRKYQVVREESDLMCAKGARACFKLEYETLSGSFDAWDDSEIVMVHYIVDLKTANIGFALVASEPDAITLRHEYTQAIILVVRVEGLQEAFLNMGETHRVVAALHTRLHDGYNMTIDNASLIRYLWENPKTRYMIFKGPVSEDAIDVQADWLSANLNKYFKIV